MAHPRARRDVAAHLRIEGDQAHAVLLPEHQVGQAGREPRGVLPFGEAAAAPVIHRAAQIEQQGRAEIRLLLVLADVIAIRAPEDAPVDVANLVARHIRPVLLELDGKALVRRAVQAGRKGLPPPAAPAPADCVIFCRSAGLRKSVTCAMREQRGTTPAGRPGAARARSRVRPGRAAPRRPSG